MLVAEAGVSQHKTDLSNWTDKQKLDYWDRRNHGLRGQTGALFVFAELPMPLEPRNLLFDRRWYTLGNDQPIALLEG